MHPKGAAAAEIESGCRRATLIGGALSRWSQHCAHRNRAGQNASRQRIVLTGSAVAGAQFWRIRVQLPRALTTSRACERSASGTLGIVSCSSMRALGVAPGLAETHVMRNAWKRRLPCPIPSFSQRFPRC